MIGPIDGAKLIIQDELGKQSPAIRRHNPYTWKPYSWWLELQIDLACIDIQLEARQQLSRLRAHLVGAFDENSTQHRARLDAIRLRLAPGTPRSEVR